MRDLFFLSCGTFRVPAVAISPPRLPPPSGLLEMSNTVAVLVRDSGDIVLVDVGWSEAACLDPDGVVGRIRSRFMGMHASARDPIAVQLRILGIDRARVKHIIATHLHLDHVGGAVDFPNAELVCSDVELSAFRSLAPRGGYRAADLVSRDRVRPIAIEGAPSYGFPGSHDLFGDGEVVLLDANGHTAGLLAVALRSRARGGHCYVHVGDAVYQSWEYALAPSGPAPIAHMTAWRRDRLKERYASLRACEADPRHPIVVPSHDADVLRTLPRGPSVDRAPASDAPSHAVS